jgi:hypothetical protein
VSRKRLRRNWKESSTILQKLKWKWLNQGNKDEVKEKELKFLESKQKELEKTLLAFENKNFYKHVAIPVQLAVADDLRILKGLEKYRAEAAKIYTPKVLWRPERTYRRKRCSPESLKKVHLLERSPARNAMK